MRVDDEARMISEQTTEWLLAGYDAYWKEARANTKLNADAEVVLSVIIDCVRSTGDEAGWTDYLTDEKLASDAGCSRHARRVRLEFELRLERRRDECRGLERR